MLRSKRRTERLRQKRNATPPPRAFRVLLPLTHLQEAQVMLPLAEFLLKSRQGNLVILHVVTVPEGHPLSEAAAEASRSRQAFNAFLDDRGYTSAQVKTVVRVAHEVWEGIWETVEEEGIDLLLFAWCSSVIPDTAVGKQVDPRLARPPCGVVTVNPAAGLAETGDWSAVDSILLAASKGPSAGLSLRVAQALAEQVDADITLLHVRGKAGNQAPDGWSSSLSTALHGLERVSRLVTVKGEASDAILREARDHDLVLMGAPTRRVGPDGWHGPVLDAVEEQLDSTLVVVKEPVEFPQQAFPSSSRRKLHPDRALAVIVDKWFAENTFMSREYADLEQLLALKETQGLTISLGLPALNEQETVGNVIRTVKSALMDQVPLLDEMVLIDSGSADYTREIAADLGLPVYIHQDILPQYGSYTGKGEALWKSLYVLKGDVIAWIDTDIKNIHPRFVYGILGPLLRQSHIQYAKGFYRRPLIRGDKLVAGGGGRVTELTARPFINLFFPELSGLIQPLSGEYAGRRVALERLPFFSGYGVETGLLIDLFRGYGLQAIAQVDLLERIHHNQKLHSLSKMSFAIMQVVLKRLGERHNIQVLDEANLTMNLIRTAASRFYVEAVEIQERERPPMIRIPEYRERRGLKAVPDDGLSPYTGELSGEGITSL